MMLQYLLSFLPLSIKGVKAISWNIIGEYCSDYLEILIFKCLPSLFRAHLVVLLTQGAVVGVSVVQTVNLLAAVSTLLLLVLNKGFMDSRHFTIYN